MNRRRHRTAALSVLMAVGTLGMIVPPNTSRAQTPPPPAAGAAAARTRPLGDVLAAMNRAVGTGISLVADSTVAAASVPVPTEPTTLENFEKQIDALVKALPVGATWGKLYLPAPPSRRGYDGDAVAEYALAEAKLFGPVGGATPAGTVEILGRKLPADRAQAHIQGLGLQPVYLVSRPGARGGAVSLVPNAANAGQWQNMTPEQRREFATAQAQALGAMDPAARNALLQQHFLVFGSFMRQLSPDDQQSIFQGMMGPGANVVVRFRSKDDGAPPPVIVVPATQP
jgi:hypothetical protein